MGSRAELNKLIVDLGLVEYKVCSYSENKELSLLLEQGLQLPDNRVKDNEIKGKFYEVLRNDLSAEEVDLLLKMKQTKSLETIKNCILLFTVISLLAFLAPLFGFFV